MSDKHTDAQGNVFRKKPVEVEAIQWDGNKFDATPPQWFCDAMYAFGNPGFLMRFDNNIVIETLEGQMTASPGDWIIRGVKGEIYPCKPDIFELTYERATEGQAQTSAAGWLTGLPVVPVGDYCEFIIACKRANGKTHVFSAYYLNGKGLLSRWGDEPEDGTPVTGWFFENEVDGDNVFELVCHEGDEITHWQAMPDAPDAAQLADSTAPGAPEVATLLVDFKKALQLANTVGKSRQDNGYALNSTAVDALVTLQMSIEDRIRALAAPTAQQSLTAGGAVPVAWRYQRDSQARPGVPDGEWLLHDANEKALELQGKKGLKANDSFHCWEPLFLAAAPLPQVQSEALEPVDGDVLPAVGSKVLIHLGRQDAWVEHEVTGYYVWGDLGKNPALHRVFVRVKDAQGYDNARLLMDVRAADKQPVTPSGALADNDGGVA